MIPRSFIILSTTTLFLLFLAFISVSSDKRFSEYDKEAVIAFPLLNAEPSAVSRIIFVNSSGRFAFYRNSDSIWVSAEKEDYPVLPKLIGRITTQLADMKRIEKKTRLGERFKSIGLEDPSDPGSNSALVRLESSNGKVLAEAILGAQTSYKTTLASKGTFIRGVDDDQAWLASGTVDLPYHPDDWLDKRLIDIEPNSIQKLQLLGPNAEAYLIARQKPGDQFLILTPNGLIKIDSDLQKTLTTGFSKLTFDDTFQADKRGKKTKKLNLLVSTFNGLQINLTLWRDGETYIIALDAVVSSTDKTIAAHSKSEELNQRFHTWNYIIAKWKAEKFLGPLRTLKVSYKKM